MRTAPQLPRGRHGLTREEVHASQRGRMFEAIARAVAEKGYVNTSVADVIGRAGVSRETFYEHFRDKEDCFHAAIDVVSGVLAGRVVSALERGGDADPLARLDTALEAYLEGLAEEPALARTFLIEVYGAGPEAARRRVEVMRRSVDLVAQIVSADDDERRFACETFVGGVSSLVTMRLASGEEDSLPALREPLMAVARRLLGTRT